MRLGIRSWLFNDLGIGKHIKTFNFEEFFPGQTFYLRLQVSSLAFGGITHEESVFVSSMALFLKAQNAFEFGTCTGLTTYNLAQNITGKVYTLDLPQGTPPQLYTENAEQEFMTIKTENLLWQGRPESGKIVPLYGDSADFDYSPYLGKMDLVFVDASHSYEYVKNDSEKALAMLAPRGAVLWHDYTLPWPGVVRYLNELSGTLPLRQVRGTSLVVYMKDSK